MACGADELMRVQAAEKTKTCWVCQGKDSKFIFKKDGKSFARCLSCGLIYQESAPVAEETEGYYQKGYYESFGERNKAILEARVSLYDDFLSRAAPYYQTGRLLDIGSGWGHFLKKAKTEGWEVWGVEPSKEASESARKDLGGQIFNASVESLDFPENYFDVITLWNVIDCLPDPASALQKIRRWLAPGGLLFIRTPNAFFHWNLFKFQARFRPLLEKFGWKKEASVFLRSNFDAFTLKKLLIVSGFDSLRIRNGKLTQGDAYQVFSRSFVMNLGKKIVYLSSQFVKVLSGGKLFIGSNLTVFASKEILEERSPQALKTRIVLKSIALHLLAGLGYLLGLPLWQKILGKGREVQILLYHNVNPFGKSDMNVRPGQFEKQIEFLTKHYTVLSLKDAVNSLKEDRSLRGQSAVAITFDDGYEDNYQVVFPLLKNKKLSATIFLLAGEEGRERRASHLGEVARSYNRLLDWNEVREMAALGISFGSHGLSHGRFKGLTDEVLLRELTESKGKIEKEIGQAVHFFSYPYGTSVDFDQKSERFTREAGYEAALSARFGTNDSRTDRFALKRIGIEASDTLFTFRSKLNGALGLLAFFDWPPVRRLIRWLDSIFLRQPSQISVKPSPLLLVSVDFPPHTDGVSTISKEISARIAKQGTEIWVIGPKDRGDEAFDRVQPYRVFRVPGYEWGYGRFIPILFWMPFIVFRYRIRRILAMNIAYGGILSWTLSFLVPLEYLVFAYGYEFEKVKKHPLMRRLYLGIYRRAKKVVACSEWVRRSLIQFGVDPGKIKVLYPAVDLDRFYPCEIPESYLKQKGLEGRRILLTVGRLIERKGHDRVIESLPEIVKVFPDVIYCIVGIGPNETRLRELVNSLKVENHVHFMGKVSDEELPFLYNACKVFVMPSREIIEDGHVEGFGIVYLEANACAKPVIGGNSGGVPEAIREGETGFLVDPESSEQTAGKIVYLLSHPEIAEKMGQKALQWSQEFNPDHYVKESYRFLTGEELT